MQPKFVHLRLHTEYSIVDGQVRIKPLIEACVRHNMPAVAITDRVNFFGLVKFYTAALNAGIKPIVGADVMLKNEKDEARPFFATLLCQNNIGYKNVTRLISRAYLLGQRLGVPLLEREWLYEANKGIIVLSGAKQGDIGHALLANSIDEAKELLLDWRKYFPDRYYLELQRTGRSDDENYLQQAVQFASKNSVPVVATNDVRFLTKDDFEAHEARVCIHDGYILDDDKRPHNYSGEQYLKNSLEMCELFRDIPEALVNSVEIAKRCNIELQLGEVFLPKFPVPSDITLENYLENEAVKGLKERHYPAEQQEIYQQRLQFELSIILQMGFAGYFLIVADFIKWAKNNGIPVGPGRGSGAGSLVAYALQITDLDPIKHELLFERFLNPERVSMPDFDIDFCMEGRDRVIEYVAKRYGRESVSQIITFGTMAAKAVVRDVGRVLGHPYGYVDKIAKLIPFELGITLDHALEQEERLAELYKNDDEVHTLIDLAKKLEGLTRNAGKHAGGVVIAPSRLTDFTPLYCEEGGENLVTQFDKNDVEIVGLVKFDFLGLRTLTIINWTLQNICERTKENLDITKIPTDDAKTFTLLKACETTAVFQLESRGMKDLIRRLQPDCFDDIVALVALFRPGPLQSGMVDDFIERKHGRSQIRYPHQNLAPILRSTYGVILYQEQVMQIAQVLAGYSLGAADLLRRAMGKKKPEEMAKQRAVFMEGAVKNGIDKQVANGIFDLMEKFAGYGFNKSHSAGYALISYQTAWLKAHYPAEFMAAVLSSDMDNTDKVVLFVNECKNMQLEIIPPDINSGHYKFTVGANGEIIYGLGSIKGVGAAAIDNIIAERNENGAFKNLFEFCRRVDTRKANKRVLEALIASGAMDSLGSHRASQFVSIQEALKAAEQHKKQETSGQNDLFVELIKVEDDDNHSYADVGKWSDEERLKHEAETLGHYISGHPIEKYENELAEFTTAEISKLATDGSKRVVLAGFVASVKTLITKSNKHMAVISLEDRSGHIDVTIFAETFSQVRDLLVKGQLLVVEGEINVDNFTGGFRVEAKRVFTFQQARNEFAKCLILKIASDKIAGDFIGKLKSILESHLNGNCIISINYQHNNISSKLLLGDEWRVALDDALIAGLQKEFGAQNVIVRY